jgi:hypothetical protein
MSDKPLSQRLLIKPGKTVLLIDPPPSYEVELGQLPDGVRLTREPYAPVDIIQAFLRDRQALERELPRLKGLLKPGGLLWVTYYKGTAKVKTDINRDSINTFANTIGMQGVAMIAVDEDWAALRLKILN